MNNPNNDLVKEVMKKEVVRKQKLSPETLNSFNYGACALPVVYNLLYKRYKIAIAFLVMTAIPHLVSNFASSIFYTIIARTIFLLTVLLALYSGKTANKFAYEARNYDDEQDFIKSQRLWLPVAAIALIAHIYLLPMQFTGHYNTVQMIKIAQAKQQLKKAIQKGAEAGDLLGVNSTENMIPGYFSNYLTRNVFDGEKTIYMPNKYVYTIEGYDYDCGTRESNSYHEQKTACAMITIDTNGKKGPNILSTLQDVDSIKGTIKTTKRLNDRFTLYVYNDDLAPKKGSIEEYALKRFERR